MNEEIGTDAAQFPEEKSINWDFHCSASPSHHLPYHLSLLSISIFLPNLKRGITPIGSVRIAYTEIPY
jgi:hypothetical protein